MVKRTKRARPAKRSWKSRIVGHGEVEASKLLANPHNISGVLDEVGWVQQVIVNKRTGFVVDGHARVALAIERGEKVPVVYVDLSEEEERVILASFDPLSAMAVADDQALEELLIGADAGESAKLLDTILEESQKTSLSDFVEPPAPETQLGAKMVKAVLYPADSNVFERALAATGKISRAEALMEVCNFYLSHQEG